MLKILKVLLNLYAFLFAKNKNYFKMHDLKKSNFYF
jgi:hypothetical protein